jgi:hypothetical protein
LRKKVLFAVDGMMSFSLVPLRLSIFFGFGAAALSVLGIVYALILRMFTGIWAPGWTLLFMSVFFLGGVTLTCLGIVGEYVGRIYRELKRRPLYLVDEKLGFTTRLLPNMTGE